MTNLVYILNSYEEYGAEDIVATLDKTMVPKLLSGIQLHIIELTEL